METPEIQRFALPAFMVLFFGWRLVRLWRARARVPELLKRGAVVVDVRSAEEYATGAREGSLNIPLPELSKQLDRLERDRPIILCCASGARSGVAAALLKRNGFKEVLNAGSWTNTVTSA